MKWFWGLLIVFIGLLFLGNNFGFWSSWQVQQLVDFWPLLLILFGIALICRSWRLGWIIVLIAFIVSGVFVVNALSSQPILIDNLKNEPKSIITPLNIDLPSGVTNAQINIKTGATNLKIQGDSSTFLSGQMKSGFLKPEITSRLDGDKLVVNIETLKVNQGRRWRTANDLDLALTNNIPIDININAGASSLDLGLEKVKITKINIDSGASSIKIRFGNELQDKAQISLDAGVSSIDISFPKEIGVAARVEAGLASKNFRDFQKSDNQTYKSNDYESASKKVDIIIRAGASSIDVWRS